MTEREQFEAWLVRRKGPTCDTPGYPGALPFFHDQEDAAWEGWQAARAQPAQAVPVLTEQEIVKCLTASGCVGTVKMSYDSGPYEITRTSINADRFARLIEQAVRAKMGVAVPMTDTQARAVIASTAYAFEALDIVRATEKFHGIVGKEGA